MDADAPRRRWYRKKRWRAFIAFWLALPVLYPLSIGPVLYCWYRGWISSRETPAGALVLAEPFDTLYAPLGTLPRLPAAWQVRWNAYGQWWVRLADEHKNPPRNLTPPDDLRPAPAGTSPGFSEPAGPDPAIDQDADAQINRAHWTPPKSATPSES